MSKTRLKPMVEWKDINWRKLERCVFKLQKRIYQASNRGDVKAIRRLQKTLMKSWAARCLAVRRVTQDNQGKKTAGVDGRESLTPKQRLCLVTKLKLGSKVAPTRRVWIPKPGTDEKRPLGIPTMNDRALQALVKMAIEPEWEARFEPYSYGFRPGRSCQDAIGAIFNCIRYKNKYVLDADIAKCFDRIDHQALLNKLNTSPTIRRQVRAWLKAGVMDNKQLFPTSEGTPQGGVISPLLANIALHGMEQRIKKEFPRRDTSIKGKRISYNPAYLIRYADDFVILHEDITVVQRCKELIQEWLKDMGLELKPSKTRLVHTLNQMDGQPPGFDFLGFRIRQFPSGKHTSGKNTRKELLGFTTVITPSKEKVKAHLKDLSKLIDTHKAASQSKLIEIINPVIKGWANYYKTVPSGKTFHKLSFMMYQKLRAWAKHRHPNKSKKWVSNRYWHTIGDDHWVFATKEGDKNPLRLLKHGQIKIIDHAKVKGESSPYDGNLVYWSTRMGDNPEMPKRVSKLLKQQEGKCDHCGLFFREDDVMEVDHRIPKSKGGKDSYENWQLLHRHCHDTKTATDLAKAKAEETEIIERFERVKAIAQAYATNTDPNLRQSVDVLGNKSGCNSAEPKPTKRLEKVADKWVMRYV